MNGKQRVLAAMEHRATDRTPITFDAEDEVYAALHQRLGTDSKEALFDRLGVDTWMLIPGNYLYPESENDKKEKTATWGYRTVNTAYSGGTYDELCHSPLAGNDDPAAIDAFPWPEAGLLDYSAFAGDAAAHADRAVIGTFSWGAYFIASFVRGMEDLMMDFALRPEYAEKLIRTIADRSEAMLDRLLTECGDGIDIVYMADDYCSQRSPLFSPATFRDMVLPYLSRFVDKVHKHNKKFLLHVCGAVRPLLPMIIEAGVDMLEPIQIRAEGMEPAALKKDFGKDIAFYGGMDLQEVLCKATPDGVADETRRLISILGDGGGYVFGPGHTYIQVDAPLENIMAMYDTARKF